MNNNTDHIISNENDVPSFTFTEWPLDEDDEEFRAGYPFSPVPSEGLSEQETWPDPPPKSNDDDFQLDNSLNNGFNEKIEANDQSNRSLYDAQEKFVKFDVKPSTIHDDNNDYNVNANQKQDHKEHERNQYNQYSIEQTDNVNDQQANQAHPVKQKSDNIVVNCIEKKKTVA